jgi:hypothetical protein
MNWRYPAQEQNYLDNPAMLDYEKQLGRSKLNFTDYDEFLRVTDPTQATFCKGDVSVCQARLFRYRTACRGLRAPKARRHQGFCNRCPGAISTYDTFAKC